MPLSDAAIRRAKCPGNKKQIKLSDGNSLYLLVLKKGGKYWRMDYRAENKRKTLALGVYPDVSLLDARNACQQARTSNAAGIDPGAAPEAVQTFGSVFEEWLAQREHILSPRTVGEIQARMTLNALPKIAALSLDSITPPCVLAVVRDIEAKGNIHTAHRVKGIIGQVMRYAIATGRATFDPTPSLRGALMQEKPKSRATMLDPKEIGGLMRAIDGYHGQASVRGALMVLIQCFVRPGELRHAEWNEIDLPKKEWRIPEDRMKIKGRGDHIVPLSSQCITVLLEMQHTYGKMGLVFPGARKGRPLSENTLNVALRSMGYDGDTQTAHGFRATARSLLAEQGWQIDAIERQLAHAEKDRIAQAYARAEYLDVRREMMQSWSDYLQKLKTG